MFISSTTTVRVLSIGVERGSKVRSQAELGEGLAANRGGASPSYMNKTQNVHEKMNTIIPCTLTWTHFCKFNNYCLNKER